MATNGNHSYEYYANGIDFMEIRKIDADSIEEALDVQAQFCGFKNRRDERNHSRYEDHPEAYYASLVDNDTEEIVWTHDLDNEYPDLRTELDPEDEEKRIVERTEAFLRRIRSEEAHS